MGNHRKEKKKKMRKLSLSFYQDDDVVALSKKLIGKHLLTQINGSIITGGEIVETEAYAGITDKASHAYNNRLTKRTKTMYEQGGVAYVYLCYGMHHLLNVVTNKQGIPHAVLIRAIKPLVGIDLMIKRRKKNKLDSTLTSGPGSLSQALGITKKQNGISFFSSKEIWIEDKKKTPEKNIISSPRVGVSYAEEDALLPWRFQKKDNPWSGKPK